MNYVKWIKKINFQNLLDIEKFTLHSYFTKCGSFELIENKNTLWDFIPQNKEDYKKRNNLIYIITCDEKILKIGGSKTGLEGRILSYKCGHCIPERISPRTGKNYPGKMSVTNAYLYNTIYDLLLKEYKIELYSYSIPKIEIEIDIFGNNKKILPQTYDDYEQSALDEYKNVKGEYPPLNYNGHPKMNKV